MNTTLFAKAANGSAPSPYQGGFTVTLLTHDDIPAFLELQQTIQNDLPDEHKHHLKVRTHEDLTSHLDAGMPLIGVKCDDGRLVGQVLMSFADNKAAKNLEGYPIHGQEKDVTAIVQSVGIHPAFRGKPYNLSSILHREIVAQAQQFDKSILMAKVSNTNTASENSFLRQGFTLAATGHDPAQNYPVSYFTKPVSANTAFLPPPVRAAQPDVLALAR